MNKLTKAQEERKLSAGYSVVIGPNLGDVVLKKGKDTWGDSVRAMNHLTIQLARQKKEIIEKLRKQNAK